MRPPAATAALHVVRALVLISVSAAAAAALARRRGRAAEVLRAQNVVKGGTRILLSIDIGSSSVRCSAYTVESRPLLVPGCAVQIKHPVVRESDGSADADEVIGLVDRAVDCCFR